MKKIVLIRHGKAAMAGKDHERELDEDGIIQARSLKNKLIEIDLNNAKIYTSPFKRAIQTIKPFAETNKSIIISEKKELEEIHMPKDDNLSKHQIIEKMWSDQNFKVKNGSSQSEHVKMIKQNIEKILKEFYQNDYNLILVSHGNSIGIILKYFLNTNFTFNDWKKISMPDMYCLEFNENNKVISFNRDIEDIEKIFTI